MSPPSLLLELLCAGLGCWDAAKLSAPEKSWLLLLLLPGKERCCGRGTSEVALARFTRLQCVQRYHWSKPREKQRPVGRAVTCFMFSGAHIHFYYRIIEQPRVEGILKDLLVQAFCGKGSLSSSTLGLAHLENSSDGDSTTSLGRLFQ